MDIIITTRRHYPVTDEVLYALVRESYQQWTEAGIQAPWMDRTFEDFATMIQSAVVFLAIESQPDDALVESDTVSTNHLVGMHCFNCYKKQHYAFGFYLAISPRVKHQGIATRMLEYEIDRFKVHGYQYLQGRTSAEAAWSVRWHLKNGYHITGYSRSPSPYTSHNTFRLQLAPFSLSHPSTWLWSTSLAPLTARINYMASYVIACLCKKRNGQLTAIGRLAKKVRGFK